MRMKYCKLICCMICMMIVATTVRSQSVSHWSCDIHAYQYDMTVYLQLKYGGKVLSDYSDYEIAAFCGGECRGVATILTTQQGDVRTSIVRIRVRSNDINGDEITFRIYQKSTTEEMLLEEVLIFESLKVEGSPSEALVLRLPKILMGDVNGDDAINVTDVGMVIDHILEHTPSGFVEAAADLNNDGDVNVTDVGIIIEIILSDGTSSKQNKKINAVDMLDPQ